MRVQQIVRRVVSSVAFVGLCLMLQAAGAMSQGLGKDIAPQPLAEALESFATQTGLQLVYRAEIATGRVTKGARAGMSAEETLRELLRETGLTFEFLNDRTIAIRAAKADEKAMRMDSPLVVAQAEAPAQPAAGPAADTQAQTQSQSNTMSRTADDIPEVLVKGRRIFNVDEERTVDDPQPYYIFDSAAIQGSGAQDLQSFLKDRVTMNQSYSSSTQGTLSAGSVSRAGSSSISLRGIGFGFDTLILVNGRRQPASRQGAGQGQPDINYIPLSAIDTIEVLPASAGALYGGNAVGGVLNIVLKQNYSGLELRASYNDTWDGGAPISTFDLSGGTTLEDGRTHVMLVGSLKNTDTLRVGDRPQLTKRYVETIRANNPDFTGISSLGGATNIVSQTGVPLVLDDGTPLGSDRTFVPDGYAGASTDGGQALVANAGQFNLEVPQSNQLVSPPGLQSFLGYTPETEYLMGSVRRQMTQRLELFAEYAFATNTTESVIHPLRTFNLTVPAGAPTNPFQQNVFVHVPYTAEAPVFARQTTKRATAGGLVQLPGDWLAQFDAAWSDREMNSSTYIDGGGNNGLNAAIGTGAVDVFRDVNAFPIDASPYATQAPQVSNLPAQSIDYSLRFHGPVALLAPGSLDGTVTVGMDRRDETYEEGSQTTTSPTIERVTLIPENSQTIDSAYLELKAPLLDDGARQLEVQLAGRYDRYKSDSATSNITSVNGSPFPEVERVESEYSAATYTAAVSFSPLHDITLRASYGTGFRPPLFGDLLPGEGLGFPFLPVIDRRQTEDPSDDFETFIDATFGGNPDLEPETSTSFTAGIVFTPRFLSGLRLSVDYTRIDKEDVILTPEPQFLVDNELAFPDDVIRGDPPAPGVLGDLLLVNNSSINLNKLESEAYDAALSYRFSTDRFGEFELRALATWLMHTRQQVTTDSGFEELVNAPRGPWSGALQKFKGNAGLSWQRGGWNAGWNVRYIPSYLTGDTPEVILAQTGDPEATEARVSSQMYHDAFASYLFESNGAGGIAAALDQLEVRFGVRNLFDEAPPLDAGSLSYWYSLYGEPRMREYTFSIRKGF